MLTSFVVDKFLKSLDRLQVGQLSLTLPDGKVRVFAGGAPGPLADLRIHDWCVPLKLALKGDVGFADDYRAGLWESSNLEDLISLGLLNETVVRPYIFGGALAQRIGNFAHRLHANTLKGSRRNIHAHYDLGNEFYSLWLDPTMTYSSALFVEAGQDLAQAQQNKYDRILDRLSARSGSVLEIGCGWGGFAERATTKSDFAVKGITLSDAQHDYAARRVGQSATIALEDYRVQQGTFDNIVSIEMFEAVGERFWPTYFAKLSALLRQGGRAVIQTITIDDKLFDQYRGGTDFIRSFIFPGGMLPSPARFAQEAAKAGFRINDRFEFGQDYARTLSHWLRTFESKKEAVCALGFDDSFIRLWRFYLAACIAGFQTGRTGVMQVEMQHA